MSRAGYCSSLLCALLLSSTLCWAHETVKFGILAFRPKPITQAQWQPLAAALHKAIPEYDFVVETYDFRELQAVVAARQVDFVLTNPGNYLLLDERSGLSAPLVTLSNLEQGQAVSALGGVIFTKAGRKDIRELKDLRGKTVAATTTDSLGGYQIQAYELSLIGLKLPRDIRLITTGMPQDKIITEVLSGRADVGFVRTGELESLAQEGKLDLRQVQIIHLENLPGYPVAVSTRLYPEWPLAALPQTNKDLQRKVASYLLTLHDDPQLIRALHINGFDVPADYTPVATLLRELRMPPYDRVPDFTLADVWKRYRWPFIAALIALSAIVLLAFNLIRVNRRLKYKKQLVQLHTEQLTANNALLDSIIDNIPIIVTLKQASDLSYSLLNRAGEALLGQSRAELLGHSPYDINFKDQADDATRQDRESLRHNGVVEIPEEQVYTLSGPRTLHTKKIVLRDENGQPSYLLGISEDITERIAANKLLQESISSLAATLQAIPDLMLEFDQQGTYLNIWTQNPARLFAKRELLLGHTVSEMLPAAAAQTIMTTLQEAQRDGTSRGRVLQLKILNDIRWFELSASLKSGNVSGEHRFIVLARDITDRMLAEQTLSKNEERLRLALTAAKQGWFDVNVQTGAVLISPEYIRMLGYDPQDFHTDMDTWVASLHPDDRDELLRVLRECLISGEPRTMQYRRRDALGKWLWISSVGQVTEWDQQHQPLRMVGIHTDISDFKSAEAALQHANRSFAILSAVNRNLVHATDEGRLLQSVCQTIIEQRGYCMAWVGYLQHDEAQTIRPVAHSGLDKSYVETARVIWTEDNERGRGTTGRAARTGQMHISQNIQTDDSMSPWREAALRQGYSSCISLPLIHEHKVFGVLVIYAAQTDAFVHEEANLLQELANDLAFGVKSLQARHERDSALDALSVTALQLTRANQQIEEERAQLADRVTERTAQLLQANKSKDIFLASMSHEIRTPLGGLLGMMELLDLSQLDDKQRDMLRMARSSGKSLLRIVDDILDWSKIEAGKLQISPHPGSLVETISNVIDTYTQPAREKGLQLKQTIDEKLSSAHLYDPLRLSQILNNFTSNALKFTERGDIEISATLIGRLSGIERISLCVKDSGSGISKTHLARLFEHYEQASADTARMYGGTGLGLAICRSLAELQGGELSVESRVGIGSTFCFTVNLPVTERLPQAELQSLHNLCSAVDIPVTPLQTADGSAISALLVDDHPVNRMLLKQQLESMALTVDAAADGHEALALWQTGNYDIVITDCHMPEMDGYELTRNIRAVEKADGLPHIPVIAWTANVLSDEIERSRNAGMDDLLTKPSDLHSLHAMLLKWLPHAVSHTLPSSVTTSRPAPSDIAVDQPIAIDFSVLHRYARTRSAQIELLTEFNLHNRVDIEGLGAALQSNDTVVAARHAHRIKGACRMIGALELESICTRIEQAATLGDMTTARETAGLALEAALSRVEQSIREFIDGQ